MLDFKNIIPFVKTNPQQAKEPYDMLYYTNGYNRAQLNQSFPGPGVHEYLNEPEKLRSKSDWPPFSYVINEQGFRDVLPSTDTKNLLGFFGCSITFGEGMDSRDNFPYIVSTAMNREHINLGLPGSSAMRTALIFDAASNIWDMDTAIITLPNFDRFLYMDKECLLNNIIPPHEQPPGTENEAVRKCLVHEFSDQYFQYMTLLSVNYIINTAKAKNIKLLLGTWHPEVAYFIEVVFDYKMPILENDYTCKTARDNAHPHPSSCKVYADTLIDLLHQNKFIVNPNA